MKAPIQASSLTAGTRHLAELSALYLPSLEEELRRAVGSEALHGSWVARHRATASAIPADAGREYLGDYYAMLAHHLGWNDGQASGKRIRPLLCLLCCAAAGGDWRQALPLAAAIELVHNFSLIHDDIQDNSPLRRGRPTVWALWGPAQAINAGDAMFTLAHLAPQRLLEAGLPADTVLSALAELDQTCLALTQGQHLDMDFEQRAIVSVAEYLAMIEKKTAALIAAATGLGAQIAGAGSARLGAFRDYGWNLGVAFQLQDDLLGIWGDPAVTGKSAASDLEKRKKSLPVVFGLERSPAFARAYAAAHTDGEPVDSLARQLEALGARDYLEGFVQAATARATEALELAQAGEPAGSALRELTNQLLDRKL
jgi:geranylgeranyl diphosphate synthase, type I